MIEALIVTHNSAGEIDECLRAVQASGIAAAVLDNDSADGSADLIAERFPGVRLIRSDTNLGFGAATNELARTSRSEYLMALNPDAIIAPETPAALQAALDADPLAVAAGPKLVYPDGKRQPSNYRFPDLTYELAEILAGTRLSQAGPWDGVAHVERVMRWSWSGDGATEPTEALWATCWLLRAQDVHRHGLFDRRLPLYDEDLFYCRQIGEAGRHLLYVPSTTVVHYGGSSSTSARKRRLVRRARYTYYRLTRGPVYALGYLLVVDVVGPGVRLVQRIRNARHGPRHLGDARS